MANNEGGNRSEKLQAWQPNQYNICKMTESIIEVKCDETYCDGTSWRHFDLALMVTS